MKLLDISDPTNEVEEVQDQGLAIGIDLGTTNSLIACSKNQAPQIVALDDTQLSLPSIVTYQDTGDVVVGSVSSDSSATVIKSVKRLMGKGISDIDRDDLLLKHLFAKEKDNSKFINLKVSADKTVTPIEVAAEILRKLRDHAEQKLSTNINKAVITVPAYFDDSARSATMQAAQLAGIEVLRLINEPTAAALAYGLDDKYEGIYVVYDLGGGTFDVSILDMKQGLFKVIATSGDTKLGGDDFDRAIMQDLAKNYIADCVTENLTLKEQYSLLEFARNLKEELSNESQFKGELNLAGKTYEISYDREQLDNLLKPFIDKTLEIISLALKDSSKKIADINEVILVGGSTRTIYVQSRLEQYFAKKPLCNINPDQVVALGAALQAESLTYGTNNLLVDVVPLSLGIETMGGMVEKIIERNTPVPAFGKQEFTTYEDNQTGLIIHLLQGERELVDQNRSLAKFEFNNIPLMPAGQPKIEINFQIDRDGLLTVTALEKISNLKQEIQVKPSFGLDQEKVLELLQDSMQNAKSDMKARLEAKYRFEIKEKVKAIRNLIENDSDFFTKEQIRDAKEFAKKSLIFIDKQKEFSELQEYHGGVKKYLDDLAVSKVSSITKSLEGRSVVELKDFFTRDEQ